MGRPAHTLHPLARGGGGQRDYTWRLIPAMPPKYDLPTVGAAVEQTKMEWGGFSMQIRGDEGHIPLPPLASPCLPLPPWIGWVANAPTVCSHSPLPPSPLPPVQRKREVQASAGRGTMTPEEAAALARREAARSRVAQRTAQGFGFL